MNTMRLLTLFLCLPFFLAVPASLADPPPASSTPLQALTKPLPPRLPGDEDAEKDAAPVTELDSVIVKGRREKKETEEERIRKALEQKPKPEPNKDLNKAGEGMKEMATWQSDPDAYRHAPGDLSRRDLPPVGDETGGCTADITKGCDPAKSGR